MLVFATSARILLRLPALLQQLELSPDQAEALAARLQEAAREVRLAQASAVAKGVFEEGRDLINLRGGASRI